MKKNVTLTPVKSIINFIFIFAVLMMNCNSYAQEAVLLNWASRFASNDSIMPNAIAKAGSFTYVAGYRNDTSTGTGPDIAVVKYNSYGDTVWTNYYSGAGNHRDQATAIAVDTLTLDVYVAGFTYYSSANNYDAVLIKYNGSGVQQWVETFNGAGSYYDAASAICIRGAYVYITGASFGGLSTLVDYFTIKYDKVTGSQIWVATYDNNGNNDVAYGITVDSNDSVFVTGGSQTSSTNWDYATVAYDASGAQAYVTRVTGAGYGLDRATAITTDNRGFVYFTGGSMNVSGNYDYRTIKMNSAGTIIYNKTYDFENLDDIANAIAVDTMGNAYITGQSKSSMNDNDYCTIKYDSAGNQVWVKRYDGDAHGSDIAHNLFWDIYNNNLYVTGESSNGADQDYLTISYNHNGQELWHQIYDGGADDIAYDIIADNTDVYVTGSSVVSGVVTYVTIDYGITDFIVPPDTEHVGGTTAFFPNYGQLIHTDGSYASEVSYYTLHNYPANYFQYDTISFVFSKLDTSKNHHDTLQRIDMSFVPLEWGPDISSSPVGADKLESGYVNYYLAQCPDGITDVYPYQRVVYPEVWSHIDVEYAGNADGLVTYIVAKVGADTSNIELVFNGADSVKVLSSGELKLVSHFGSATFAAPEVYQVDAYGNRDTATLTGNYLSSSPGHIRFHIVGYANTKGLVIKVGFLHHFQPTPTCNQNSLTWSTYLGGDGFDFGTAVATDVSDNGYMTGFTTSTVFPVYNNILPYHGGEDCFISKFIYNCTVYVYPWNMAWSTYYGGSSDDEAYSINLNNTNGDVYVVGKTVSSDFPIHSNGGNFNHAAVGTNQDGFILKLKGTDGSRLWATAIGTTLAEQANCVVVNNNSSGGHVVYVMGWTKSGADFPTTCSSCTGVPYNQTVFSASGDQDAFIMKFDNADNIDWSSFYGGKLSTGGNAYTMFSGAAILNDNSIVVAGSTSSDVVYSYTWTTTPLAAQNSCSIQIANPGSGAFVSYGLGGGTGDMDMILASFNSENALLWSTYFGGTQPDWPANNCVIHSSYNNSIYILGYSQSDASAFPLYSTGSMYNQYIAFPSISPSDYVIAQFDNSFNQKWTTFFGWNTGSLNYIGIGAAIASDVNGNVYVAGSISSSSGTSTCSYSSTYAGDFPLCNLSGNNFNCSFGGDYSLGYPDAFISAFDKNNVMFWSTYMGAMNSELEGLSCTAHGQLYYVNMPVVANITSTTYEFPQYYPFTNNYYQQSLNTTLYSNTEVGLFDLNYVYTSIPENKIKTIGELLIYPNPSNSNLTLSLDFASQDFNQQISINVIDVLGRVLINNTVKVIDRLQTELNVYNLAEGAYSIQVITKDKIYNKTFIKN